MTKLLTVALAQYPITAHQTWASWEDHVTKWITAGVKQGAELLVFPEYGSMELVSLFPEEIQSDLEVQTEEITKWTDAFLQPYITGARLHNVVIVAPSIPVKERNQKVNRAFVIGPNGIAGFQDKIFMTRFENELWNITSADKHYNVFEWKGVRFGIQICYDVEFGIGAQFLASMGAQLIVAPSCTETLRGATRVHVGARARALENQIYVGVSQTVGEALWSPAVDINYGFGGIYSTPDLEMPEEGIVAVSTAQTEEWLVKTLDFDKIDWVRKEGSVFNYRDQQRIQTTLKEEEIKVHITQIDSLTQ